MYRQIWVDDVFLKYNTLQPSSSAVEQLFPEVLLFLQQNELA